MKRATTGPTNENAPPKRGADGIQLTQVKMNLSTLKNTIERNAPAGRVISQDMKIEPTTPRLSAPIPRAIPMPSTAPTSV